MRLGARQRRVLATLFQHCAPWMNCLDLCKRAKCDLDTIIQLESLGLVETERDKSRPWIRPGKPLHVSVWRARLTTLGRYEMARMIG
jgi:hypothetical protein